MFLRSLFHKEKRSTAVNDFDWLDPIIGDKDRITSNTVQSNSNVATCVHILADDVAKLPIHTYRNYDKVEGMKHPVARLLYTQANPFMTAYTFKQLMMTHIGYYGNAFAKIEWTGEGFAKAMWPLDPEKVTATVKDGKLHYEQSSSNGTIIHKPEDIIHLRHYSLDGFVGIPLWMTLADELSAQAEIKKFISKFYKNGTSIGGTLNVASALSPEAKNVIRKEWEKLHAGGDNAGKIAVLDFGIEYKDIGMPLNNAQFIETQKFGINEVAKVYKVPPHKLGQLDRATYANAEAMGLDYVKTTLLPIFTNWEQEFNTKLFTEKEQQEYYVKFNAAAELRGDSMMRSQYYEKMIGNGIYSVNDVLAMEERVGIGDIGDKHYISLNFTTLDALENYQLGKVGETPDDTKKGGEEDGSEDKTVITGDGTTD